jgi:hypothetical protein
VLGEKGGFVMRIRDSGNILIALATVGCAGSPPIEQLASSERAIAAAVAEGADALAPRDLHLARLKLDLSRRWLAAGDHEPAKWLAEQAQIDAELAGLKAAAAKSAQAPVR